METKNIDVNGEVFPCPIEWTVDQAEARIKSFYSFSRGGIRQNNVSVLGNWLIGSLTGNLVYVGGQSIQQSGKFSHHYFPITLLSYPPLSVTLSHEIALLPITGATSGGDSALSSGTSFARPPPTELTVETQSLSTG